jgi:hypothetical protein
LACTEGGKAVASVKEGEGRGGESMRDIAAQEAVKHIATIARASL